MIFFKSTEHFKSVFHARISSHLSYWNSDALSALEYRVVLKMFSTVRWAANLNSKLITL